MTTLQTKWDIRRLMSDPTLWVLWLSVFAGLVLRINSAQAQCQDGCGEISALNCSDVVVPVPFNLYFTGYEGGMEDANANQTGFTMVQWHSEDRLIQDGNPSCPAIKGYEPSRLRMFSNQLEMDAAKGIAYLDPPNSSNNNTQVNTLGVGLQLSNQIISIETQINNLNTGGGSAQTGLWYGLNEDNYLKFVAVNSNTLEFRVENNGSSAVEDAVVQSAINMTNRDVRLRVELDLSVAPQTASAFYSIDGASEQFLGTIEIPTKFANGEMLAPSVTGVSYAGIFSTYRNGNPYTVIFDHFSIRPVGQESLNFASTLQNITLQQGTNQTFDLDLSSSDASNPIVTIRALTAEGAPEWLTANGVPLSNNTTHDLVNPTVTFGVDANTLEPGTYSALVTAEADGYDQAHFILTLVVNPETGLELANFKVNFQDGSTTTPDGWLKDFGQQYAYRQDLNGQPLFYGWVREDNGTTPVSLIGAGTKRGNPADIIEATLIHMQKANITNGIWEAAVPNGAYQITVSVGDGGGFTDSQHAISAEGIEIIPPTVPAVREIITATAIITVTDGKLTIDAIGGSNTKINSIVIQPAPGSQRPAIISANIEDGATDVALNISLGTEQMYLPNEDPFTATGGIDNTTLLGNVTLTEVIGDVPVPANVNGTGGGDRIILVPNQPLEPNTLYEFKVTDGVKDITGESLIPFRLQFVTGNAGTIAPLPNVAFTKQTLGTDAQGKHTSLTFGPDGKLYAATVEGKIKRFDVNPDGTLSNMELLEPLGADPRLLVGLTFDPRATADNLIAWISYSEHPGYDGVDGPEWDGYIARISGPDLENFELVLEGMPRSVKDHLVNSLAFGPDGAIYFPIGSNSAMGKADPTWGSREERLLSAAILRLDTTKLPETLPLNVRTPDGGGTYNPYLPSAPLTIYATGMRNTYDLVWHSNGQLYAPTNGSGAGGNSPTSDPSNADYIAPHPNIVYTGPDTIPAAFNIQPTQHDWLFRVEQGGYYGHPNPLRAEYIFNRGDFDVDNPVYNGVNPDPNYRGAAYDFGVGYSPNGALEYRSNAFDGALKGKLLVVRYSQGDDIVIMEPGGSNQDIVAFYEGNEGMTGFADPLDIVEDVNTGNIYVSEFAENGNGKLILIKANDPAVPSGEIAVSPNQVIDNDVVDGNNGDFYTVTISNVGDADLEISAINLAGTDAAEFVLSDLPPVFPLILAADDTLEIQVAMNATSVGLKLAQIEMNSNDIVNPTFTVELRGLGTSGAGGNNEPSLQAILDLYNIPINTGDEDASTTDFDVSAPQTLNDLLGEELDIQRFQKAGPGNVSVEVLSVFAPTTQSTVAAFGWYASGDANATNELFTVSNNPLKNGQTVNVQTTGVSTFDVDFNTPFGFYSRWPVFGDRQIYSEDDLNTFSGAIPHNVRVYPLKNDEGQVISNAYILATEEFTAAFDFQDIVVIVRNVEPFDDPTPPSLAFDPSVFSISLEKDKTTIASIDLGIVNAEATEVNVILSALDDTTGTTPTWMNPLNSAWAENFLHDPANDPNLNFILDANGLEAGNYQATITASTEDPYENAVLTFKLTVVSGTLELEDIQVNFQDATTTPPDGWLADFGQAYGNKGELTYGWISPSDGSALSLVGNGRNRNGGATGDAILTATMMQMQYRGGAGVAEDGSWEIELPNGNYDVTVTVGDLSFNDSQHSIRAEEVVLFDQVSLARGEFATQTASVLVSDGRLTLDATGGSNTKINSVIIQATPGRLAFDQDTLTFNLEFGNNQSTQSAILTANVGTAEGLSLEQSLNTSWLTLPATPALGLAEFRVDTDGLIPGTYTATIDANAPDYESARLVVVLEVQGLEMSFEPDTLNFSVPQGSIAAPLNATLGASKGNPTVSLSRPTEASWLILPQNPALGDLSFEVNAGGLAPGQYQAIIQAQASGYSNASLVVNLEVTPLNSVFTWKHRINFQNIGRTPPAEYISDFGEGYGFRGNFGGEDLTFGWFNAFTQTITDGVQMRDRGGDPMVLNTLAQMQPSFVNDVWHWEFALEPNVYQIRVSVGDPGFFDSESRVRAEGQEVVFFDQANTGIRGNKDSTIVLEITDGRLTLDPIGGANTKINYVWIGEIEPADDNIPPVISLNFIGTELNPSEYQNQVLVEVQVNDYGNSGIASVEYSLNGGAFQSYNSLILVDEEGIYNLRVRATDGNGNVATTPDNTFRIVQGAANQTRMVLENMDAFPENDELSFSLIQEPWLGDGNIFNANHDQVTLRVHNRGLANLNITGFDISNDDYWRILKVDGLDFDPSEDLPVVVAPNDFADVVVEFIAVDPPNQRDGLVAILHETLTIISNDDENPQQAVQLHGLWQRQAESFREPNINEILEAFNLKTETGFTNKKIGTDSTITGDEVIVSFFERANPAEEIYVRQLSAYHGCCNQNEAIRYEDENPLTEIGGSRILFHLGVDAQSILPRRDTAAFSGRFGRPAEGTFETNNFFSLTVLRDCTFPNLNPPTANDPDAQGEIGIRIWKLRNSDGEIVPNTFLLANDYLGTAFTNYDYNDNLYVITNVRPLNSTGYNSVLATGTETNPQSALEFGETEIETTQNITLNLRSLGQFYPKEDDPDIQIYSVEIIGQNADEFSAQMPADALLSPQEASTMQVSFRPNQIGLKQAVLLINYNSGDSPKRVPLFGIATSDCYDAQLIKRIKTAANNPVTIAGQTWEADQTYRTGGGFQLDNTEDVTSEILETDKDALYRSYMSSNGNLKPIQYRIPVANGQYTLRVHLAENFWTNFNSRVNHISLEGETRLVGLDIFNEVGFKTALVKDFVVNVSDGALDIQFTPQVDRPAVSGFELYEFQPSLDLVATQLTSPACGGSDGAIQVELQGVANPVEYRLGRFGTYQDSNLFENLEADTYTIYAREKVAGACEIFQTFVLEAQEAPFTFTVSTTPVSCDSQNDGTAQVINLSGGVAPYTVVWNDNPAFTGFITTGLVVSDLHYVTVTDATGCSQTVNFEVRKANGCPIRINCGDDDQIVVTQDGRIFYPDQYFDKGNTSIWRVPVANTLDDRLYQSYRWFGDFNYDIPVLDGNYDVTLHFAETFPGSSGVKAFNVDIEEINFFNNIDIVAAAGGTETAFVVTYNVTVVDGQLDIHLYKSGADNPLICAIEAVRIDGVLNNPPFLATPIADQIIEVNQNFNFTIPEGTFQDADEGDELTLTVSLVNGAPLPSWLSYDEATQTFNGTPSTADAGVYNIRVRATDRESESVSDDFSITVKNSSIAVAQNVQPLLAGATDKVILQITIDNIGGSEVTNFNFATSGSSDVNDIARAKLYYTGTEGSFDTGILLGTAERPNGDFNITGFSQTLATGLNYFWLVYDVDEQANFGNVLDAELISLVLAGNNLAAGTDGRPNGNRQISQTDCVPGTALNFNGTNGAAVVNGGLTMPGQFSLEAWVHPKQNTQNLWVMGETDGAHIRQNGNQYEFFIHNGTTLEGPATAEIKLNRWNHVAAVFDGTTLKLFVNGRQGTDFNVAAGPVANADQPGDFAIGSEDGGANTNSIEVDEIRLWNSVKTIQEIRSNFRIISKGSETDLKHYWQFNEGAGITASDLVGGAQLDLSGNANWVTSTLAIGCGITMVPNTVAAKGGNSDKNTGGTIQFTGVNTLEISFAATPPNAPDVFITELETAFLVDRPTGFDVTNRYYVIDNFDPDDQTFAPIDIKFILDPDSGDVVLSNPDEYILNKRIANTGDAWTALTNSPTTDPFVSIVADAENDIIEFFGEPGNTTLTSFGFSPGDEEAGEYYITSDFDPLPIRLLSFTGRRIDETNVLLEWVTASEENNQGFEIQRSTDAQNFETIGFVDGSGTTNQRQDYQYLDVDAARSAYYRLKQVDFDGEFTYSNLVFIEGVDQSFFTIYPNPFGARDQFGIKASADIAEQKAIRVEIYRTDGSLILEEAADLEQIKLILNNRLKAMSQGMYLIKFVTRDQNYIFRMIKH